MRGRKPTPTHLKIVTGNPGRRPLNQDEPQPVGELYAPPEDMSEPQKVIWRRAIDNAPKGLLRRLDEELLAVWVVAAAQHQEARLKVAQFGAVVKSPTQGVPVQSPYMAIMNRQALIMMKAASELGFSPTSRSRITLGSSKKDTNPFTKHAPKRA